ncbi:MAG: tRNA (adenosine(37)-N6)-dimethylallyltransferase MiaA [Phycisphaerae bacterium]
MRPITTFIVGCTGCGKGALGLELARRTGGEIVSLDSMKVYRRMDIGTAKPSPEIRREIPHHVIDVVEPSEDFSVAKYVEHAERAMADIQARGKPVFVVGGTPLYLKALTEGLFEGPGADPRIRARLHEAAAVDGAATLHRRLQEVDPQAADRIHPNDLRRTVRALEVFELTGKPISTLQAQWDQERTRHDFVLIGLRRQLEDQNHRTNERVRRMIDAGLVDEVKSLLAEPKPLSTAARQALGYAEITQHLEGKVSLADAIEMIKINTRQFAKAQRTWFKRFREAEWIDLAEDSAASRIADMLMERRGWVRSA